MPLFLPDRVWVLRSQNDAIKATLEASMPLFLPLVLRSENDAIKAT